MTYGLVGLKTHAKTALVVRREQGGIAPTEAGLDVATAPAGPKRTADLTGRR